MNCRTLNENNSVNFRNYMQDNYFNILGPILNTTLTQVRSAKIEAIKTLNQKKSDFELDEEDMETLTLEIAKICSASTYVMEISG